MGKYVDRPRYGCALGGALSLLRAIPRAIPIIHSSTGCGYNVYNGINAGAAYLGGGYCGGAALPSSNIIERNVVFGGEDRLAEQVEKTIEIMDGDIYVIVTGCMVEMIGDDIYSVAREFEENDKPVIPVSTPSFQGNSYTGYDMVFSALVKEYVEAEEEKKVCKVNVIGIVPGEDVFYKGNLKEIKRILGLIGIDSNTFVGEGETLDNFKGAGNASLTIVLSDVYGVETAKVFEEIHKIPYLLTGLPIGYLQVENFLYEVGEALNIDNEVIEKALEAEKETYFDYFERITDIYNDIDLQRYGIVVADANYAPSVSRFISDELGWLPQLAMITDFLTEDQKSRLESRFENYDSELKPLVKFDTDASAVKKYIRELWPADQNERYYDALGPGFILGSVIERDFADEFNYPLLSIAFPVTNRVIFNRSYAGINGALTLTEDIFSLLVAGR
ncbi:MAG: hypothetical protein H2212_14395 [Ruminococcus sp.]|nr:hypothetical protein [Ruminococcus sp.]